MTRRGGTVPSLTVRVSHEATRLSKTHVAAAFERLVPALERQTRLPRAERSCSASSHQQAAPTQSDKVERLMASPCRPKTWLCR